MKNIADYIDTPEKRAEFKRALDRALNTWDDGPTWLFELCDDLERDEVVFNQDDFLRSIATTRTKVSQTALIEQLKMTRLSIDTTIKFLSGKVYGL